MNNSPELLQSIQEMHEAGVLADYVCQVDTIPQEDAVLLARFALASLDDGAEIRKPAVIGSAEYYRDVLDQICDYSTALRSGGPEEEDLQRLSNALGEIIDMVCDACMAEDSHLKSSGFFMRWLSVSECLPTLDTPVFGGWFSDNGNFIWGCYVRTYNADVEERVWATAEHFGEGDWLFGEDNPVEFWMPLPGKPELVGGAA